MKRFTLTSVGVSFAVLFSALFSGCANVPYVAAGSQKLKEHAEVQTGSNLTKRAGTDSLVRQVDKDAIESGLRGSNPSSLSGKTPL